MDQQLQVVIDFVGISTVCSSTKKDIAPFFFWAVIWTLVCLVRIHSAVSFVRKTVNRNTPAVNVTSLLFCFYVLYIVAQARNLTAFHKNISELQNSPFV